LEEIVKYPPATLGVAAWIIVRKVLYNNSYVGVLGIETFRHRLKELAEGLKIN